MDNNLQNSIFPIFRENGIMGTGFIIYQKPPYSYLLTTSMLVSEQGKTVGITITGLRAEVVANSNFDTIDLAVLEVQGLLDKVPLPLSKSDRLYRANNQIITAGFAKDEGQPLFHLNTGIFNGIMLSDIGSIGNLNIFSTNKFKQTRKLRIVLDNFKHNTAGFAGAPVIHKITGHVIGIIEGAHEDNQLIDILPIEYIEDIWPNMPKGLFSETLLPYGFARGAGAINDQIATEDALDFQSYVNAFAKLILSKATQPPLTIGIFGSWGTGKSFLLHHIKEKVMPTPPKKALPASQPPTDNVLAWLKMASQNLNDFFDFSPPAAPATKTENAPINVHVVEFNAWEYSANEFIWPGLVRKIMQEIEGQIQWGWKDYLDNPDLQASIYRNFSHRLTIIYPQLLIIVIVFITIVGSALWQSGLEAIPSALTGLGFGAIVGFIALAKEALDDPLSQWITSLFDEKDSYGKPLDHMEKIRADLKSLEERLGKEAQLPDRVLILIDDLDRCEPNKAVEVLQAIKLLLNFDRFIVCLGIDARIITRAIEKHYEELLGESGASGYEYLDKIIQIPFRIPQPNEDTLKKFLRQQMNIPKQIITPVTAATVIENSPGVPKTKPESTITNEGTPETISNGNESDTPPTPIPEIKYSDGFSISEFDAFERLASILRPNPRHIKRLLNIYRLVRTLAEEKQEPLILDRPDLTIYWLVICSQWPYTVSLMLKKFNHLLEDKKTEWPESDLLLYLLGEIKSDLDSKLQLKLDDDDSDLHQFLENNPNFLTWGNLETLQNYTINFNPAVETELE